MRRNYRKLCFSITLLLITTTIVIALLLNKGNNYSFKNLVFQENLLKTQQTLPIEKVHGRRFAVFSCATPDENTHRSYDYAFYLPLTALAWHRIGFESIVLIVGDPKEWLDRPVLSWIIESLKQLNATVLYLKSEKENREMLSQTARLFVVHMKGFPGGDDDYVITSDADLWPLHREHFIPRIHHSLILLHSKCCGVFGYRGSTFRMLPMSHIGTSATYWRQIIQFTVSITEDDSELILVYLSNFFSDQLVRQRVIFGSQAWSMDQKLVTVKLNEWRRKLGASDTTYEVSDDGFKRIDRASWHPKRISTDSFLHFYDAHLIEDGFTPEGWNMIRPLIHLMFDPVSWETQWAYVYAETFHFKFDILKSVN